MVVTVVGLVESRSPKCRADSECFDMPLSQIRLKVSFGTRIILQVADVMKDIESLSPRVLEPPIERLD
jgi:hypothetical protein